VFAAPAWHRRKHLTRSIAGENVVAFARFHAGRTHVAVHALLIADAHLAGLVDLEGRTVGVAFGKRVAAAANLARHASRSSAHAYGRIAQLLGVAVAIFDEALAIVRANLQGLALAMKILFRHAQRAGFADNSGLTQPWGRTTLFLRNGPVRIADDKLSFGIAQGGASRATTADGSVATIDAHWGSSRSGIEATRASVRAMATKPGSAIVPIWVRPRNSTGRSAPSGDRTDTTDASIRSRNWAARRARSAGTQPTNTVAEAGRIRARNTATDTGVSDCS
jgi:hypothetical protein